MEISFPKKVIKTYRVFYSRNLEQTIKHVTLNKSIADDLKIAKRISTAEAEIKEKQEELDLLQSRLNRSRSSTLSVHPRFATGESPESTENSRATDNVSPAQVDALNTEILELKGNLAALHQSVFDTFEQPLAVSLQAPFRRIVEEQCDSADYTDFDGKRVTGAPRGRVLSAFEAVTKASLRLYTGEEDTFELSFRWFQNHVLLNTDKAPVEALV